MQEFVIRNIWDHDLILVAKDYTTASFSFLKYLAEREYQICVLVRPGSSKYHFIDHYIVIGEQTRFSAWLKEARDKAIRFYPPTFESVSSLEDEVVRSWAEETALKQVWAYYISHEHDDEFIFHHGVAGTGDRSGAGGVQGSRISVSQHIERRVDMKAGANCAKLSL